MNLRIIIATLVLLLASSTSLAERTNVLYYGSSKPPGKYKVYIHPYYDYYIHLGDLEESLKDRVDVIIDAIDKGFNVWGNPVTPRFLGLTDCPSAYGDGINTVSLGLIMDDDNAVDPSIKGVAIYDVEANRFIDEADIILSSVSGWKELNYEVAINGVREFDCNLYSVMSHEVGHILGYTFHSNNHRSLMYWSGACAGYVTRPLPKEIIKMRKAYMWRNKMFYRQKIAITLEE